MIIYGKRLSVKQINGADINQILVWFTESIEMLYERPMHKSAQKDFKSLRAEIEKRVGK